MKKKIDLGNLLAKYEASGDHAHDYMVSPKSRASRCQYDEPVQSLGRSRDYPEIHVQPEPHHNHNINGNFQMSKSECEQFLMRVREEFRREERGMENFAQISMQEIQNRFRANHEKIKRQILELLETAFQNNQKYIIEQLKKQNHVQPQQFMPVHRKITDIDEDINRLLFGLKSSEYRRSIAEVVMKDYEKQIFSIKEDIKAAKEHYLNSLGEVEPDRQRINCIREDLQRLFRISKKNAQLVEKSLFNILGNKLKENQPQNPKQEENPMKFLLSPKNSTAGGSQRREGGFSLKEPQRKSMFNFGFFD